jgi:hypothetical protein
MAQGVVVGMGPTPTPTPTNPDPDPDPDPDPLAWWADGGRTVGARALQLGRLHHSRACLNAQGKSPAPKTDP